MISWYEFITNALRTKKGKIKTKFGSKRTSHFYRNADFKPLVAISEYNDKTIFK